MFIAGLSVMVKTGKQPNAYQQQDKLGDRHTKEYYISRRIVYKVTRRLDEFYRENIKHLLMIGLIQCPQTGKILSIHLDVQTEVTLGDRDSEWGADMRGLQVTLCFLTWMGYVSVFNLRKLTKMYIYNLCTFLFVYYTAIKYLKHKNCHLFLGYNLLSLSSWETGALVGKPQKAALVLIAVPAQHHCPLLRQSCKCWTQTAQK